MDELLIQLVSNSKVTKQIINNKISHHITGQKLPNRTFFVLLKKYAVDFFAHGTEPRMIGLSGLRGTGKTTLMWQLANTLIAKYPIYFFNVNEIVISGYTLWQVMEAFQKYVLKKRFNEVTNPFVLLFDEIHDSDDWAKTLKILYDSAKTAFIVCTGSSALLLRQTADLARRMKIEKLYPFRFIEFITAKSFFLSQNEKTIYPMRGFSGTLKNILFYSQNIDTLYDFFRKNYNSINQYISKVKVTTQMEIDDLIDEYIYYHNIPSFLLYKERSAILGGVYDLLNRVVYEDIQKIDTTIKTDSNTMLKLLLQLSISDEINPDNLSQTVKIKKDELHIIIDIMQKAELINILQPHSGPEGRIHKNQKAFFMSPSLRLSLLSILYGRNIPDNLKGKLYEDIVVMYLIKTLPENQILFARLDGTMVPDFIVETMDKPVVIEVGKGKLKTIQLKSITKRYGILISSGLDKFEIENDVVKLPLHVFLLL